MKHSFTLQIHRAGIMQSRWLPRIIQTRTQISRELRITSSFGWDAHEDDDAKDACSQKCIYIMCKTDIFFPGASGRDSAGQFGHKSSSSNWGRGGSTKHPFVPGEAFLVLTYLFVLLVKTVSCLGRINHSKCYPKYLKLLLVKTFFSLSGHLWFRSHGQCPLLPVSWQGGGGDEISGGV